MRFHGFILPCLFLLGIAGCVHDTLATVEHVDLGQVDDAPTFNLASLERPPTPMELAKTMAFVVGAEPQTHIDDPADNVAWRRWELRAEPIEGSAESAS